jgi:two-component system, OmpR family, response regulator
MNQAGNTDETSLAEPARPMVLVVDDDDAIRDALRELLEDAGFDTLGARHGLEALKLLAALATAPAFILLDLMMPVMDGWAFCDTRRDSRTFSEVPVIAISAVEPSESNRPAGVDAFLAKPIDPEKFARLAARMAGRKIRRPRTISVLH